MILSLIFNPIQAVERNGGVELDTEKEIRKAYADWIANSSWTWFITLTFRKRTSSKTADRCFQKWITAVEAKAGGSSFRWVRLMPSSVSAGSGLQVFVGGLKSNKRTRWIELWDDIAGEAQIKMLKDSLKAIGRAVRNFTAGGGFDIEFHLPGTGTDSESGLSINQTKGGSQK
jgi:hypothetical protein